MMNKKFWEELIVYFILIRHGPHRKQRLQKIIRYRREVFSESLPSSDKEIQTDPQPHMSNISSTVACFYYCGNRHTGTETAWRTRKPTLGK
jgi:hypothetical protein